MKMNQTIGIVLIAAAFFLLTRKKQQPQAPPSWYNPNAVPQQPPHNSPQWAAWAQGLINVYGAVAWLWAPGGPFYKIPSNQVYDAIGPGTAGQYDWNDPNAIPGGWA